MFFHHNLQFIPIEYIYTFIWKVFMNFFKSFVVYGSNTLSVRLIEGWFRELSIGPVRIQTTVAKRPPGIKQAFFEKHIDLIDVIVKYYTRSYHLPEADAQDLYQDLAEFLLSEAGYLERKTEGLACQRGYMYVTLLRKCNYIIKRYRKPIAYFNPGEENLRMIPDSKMSPEAQTILKDLVDKLKVYMKTYGAKQPLVEIQIKLHYKIPVTIDDLRYCFPTVNIDILRELLSGERNINNLPEGKAHEVLAPFFASIEAKTKQTGSRIRNNYNIRKEIREVLGLTLNIHLDEEALGYLFDRYFL